MPAPVQKLVGAAVTRKEDHRLLAGRGRYIADLKLHGMAHAAVLRSQHAHARIRAIDVARCREDPRAIDVLVGADLAEIPLLPNLDGSETARPFLHPAIATDVVRYVGEPLAVVVAADRATAEDLLQLIDVDYEPLPAVVDAEAAMAPDAPILHEETNVADVLRYSVGDPSAIDRAPHVVRGRFSTQRHAGMPIETRGAIAEWDDGRQTLTLHTSTQVPHFVRMVLAGFLGLPQHAVRVLVPDVGGAFGAKIQMYSEEFLVAVAAQRLRRPVKWIEDRAEHFVATTHGREQFHDMEVGYDDDGTIVAVRAQVVTNTGAYLGAWAVTEANLAAIFLRGPYRVTNFDATSTVVVTNKTPMSPFRGVGMVQPVFALERCVDLIAEERGLDPAEVRLRNMLTPEELPHDLEVSNVMSGRFVYDSGDYPAALRRALELAGYDQFRDEQRAGPDDGRHRGIGIASYVELGAMGPWESGSVRVEPSGQVVVLSGAGPSGQGTATTLAQIVADDLGVSIDDVVVRHGDTDLVQRGIGTFGSRVASIGGSAVSVASGKVKDKALKVAAELMEAAVQDLAIREGRVVVLGSPDRGLSLGEIAQALEPGAPLPAGADSYGLAAEELFHPPTNAFSYGTVVAIVEVDAETGVVTPLRLVMVGDSGTIINPMLVDGQYHGGLSLGLAGALLEEIVYSDEGQPLTTSFMDYLFPQIDNHPEIVLGHTEVPTPHNPLGVKGAGESGAIAPPGAIANAVADALRPFGVNVNETPITPARVFGMIHAGAAEPPTPAS